jgi:LysR family transcriptional regulator, glycine cleavage system transcriptional activator
LLQDAPDIELTVQVTQNFVSMEAGVQPDVYIAKLASLRDGYYSEHLFDDEVCPVCSPELFAARRSRSRHPMHCSTCR